jgi:hypothetical protein
MSQK